MHQTGDHQKGSGKTRFRFWRSTGAAICEWPEIGISAQSKHYRITVAEAGDYQTTRSRSFREVCLNVSYSRNHSIYFFREARHDLEARHHHNRSRSALRGNRIVRTLLLDAIGAPVKIDDECVGMQIYNKFMSCVEMIPECGCWIWVGPEHKDGYGRMIINARAEMAAKISWAIHHNQYKKGEKIYHTCKTRLCVNPKHLTAVAPRLPIPALSEIKLCECGCGQPTPIAKMTNNMQDALKKNRIRPGGRVLNLIRQ